METLDISASVRSFCRELFQFKIADPQLNSIQNYFFGFPIEQTEPVRLIISSEHLQFGTDNDFQLQLSIAEDRFDLWCSVFSLSEQLGHSFYYQHHLTNGDILKGDMNAVRNWLEEKIRRKGTMLDYLKIEHNIEMEE